MSNDRVDQEPADVNGLSSILLAFIAGVVISAIPALAVGRAARRIKSLSDEAHRSEKLLRHVLNILPVGVGIADKSGRIILLNPMVHQIWGEAPNVGTDQYWAYKAWQLEAGEKVADHDWALARALEKGETTINETLIIETFDGGHKTIYNSALPIREDNGEISGAIFVNQDITERKQVEDALQESREQLQAILDNTSAAIYSKDRQGRLLVVNHVFEKLVGKPCDQIIGHKDEEVLPKESAEQFATNDREVMESDTPMQVQETLQQEDGLHTYMSIKFPLHDSSGRVYGLSGISTDVTELVNLRIQVEQSLAEAQRERERVEALESISEAGISMLDVQGLLNMLVERITVALHTHSCTITILDEQTGEFVVRASYPDPEHIGFRLKPTEGLVGKIYDEKRTVYIADAEHDPLMKDPRLKESRVKSLIGTPLIVRGKVIGAVYLDVLEIKEFSPEEIRLLEDLAYRAGLAIDNSMLFDELNKNRTELQSSLRREKAFSFSLQRALAPPKPTIGEGYAVASAYLPAYAGQAIGGDFYDVFDTADGRTAVLIGDVSGKGVEAAAMAAATRSTIRAFMHETSTSGEALIHANAVLYVQQAESGLFVTSLAAVIDRATGHISYASAGHPPAAIYHCRSGVEFFEYGDPPVGLLETQIFGSHDSWLEPGDKIIFYTDGLLEARHGKDMFGLEGIQQVLEQHGEQTPEEIADEMLTAAKNYAGGRINDDTALVIIERRAE